MCKFVPLRVIGFFCPIFSPGMNARSLAPSECLKTALLLLGPFTGVEQYTIRISLFTPSHRAAGKIGFLRMFIHYGIELDRREKKLILIDQVLILS